MVVGYDHFRKPRYPKTPIQIGPSGFADPSGCPGLVGLGSKSNFTMSPALGKVPLRQMPVVGFRDPRVEPAVYIYIYYNISKTQS